MTIYDINKAMLDLFDENGELVDIEAFAALEMAREEKLKNAGLLIKENKVEISVRKGVIAALEERIAMEKRRIGYRENTIARLENYILEQLGDGEEINTPEVKIKRKQNPEKFVIEKEEEPDLIDWLEHNNYFQCITYPEPRLNKTSLKVLSRETEVPFGKVVREMTVKVD